LPSVDGLRARVSRLAGLAGLSGQAVGAWLAGIPGRAPATRADGTALATETAASRGTAITRGTAGPVSARVAE
jgi:hypothetical protein